MHAHSLTIETLSPLPMAIYGSGEVIAMAGDGYTVRSPGSVLGARRAASCLLCPEMGDIVLVAGDSRERAYIIAVLERANASPSRLTVEGDAQWSSTGSLSLEGQTGLNLSTPAQATLAADELTVRSRQASVLFERLNSISGDISATFGKLSAVGQAMESVVQRWVQSAKHSLRLIEGSDQTRSGSIDYRAQDTVALHGRNVLTSAHELVKTDAEQIHIG